VRVRRVPWERRVVAPPGVHLGIDDPLHQPAKPSNNTSDGRARSLLARK
jgi:hypothetical protein